MIDEAERNEWAYEHFLDFVNEVGEAPMADALLAVNAKLHDDCGQVRPVCHIGELLHIIRDCKRAEAIDERQFWEH